MTNGPWTAILAAGAGRRMGGRAKALLPFGETTFLEAIVATARKAGTEGVLVVIGHHREEVEPLARSLADVVAENSEPDRGMGSSVRCAARALPGERPMLVWPVDIPAVQASTVAAILEAGRAHPQQVVVPIFDEGTGGHPTLLPKVMLAEVRAMKADDRLDFLVAKRPTHRLAVNDPAVARDVDRPEDLVDL